LITVIEAANSNDLYFEIEKLSDKAYLLPPELLSKVLSYEHGYLMKRAETVLTEASTTTGTGSATFTPAEDVEVLEVLATFKADAGIADRVNDNVFCGSIRRVLVAERSAGGRLLRFGQRRAGALDRQR
jgi:hypothetical protein